MLNWCNQVLYELRLIWLIKNVDVAFFNYFVETHGAHQAAHKKNFENLNLNKDKKKKYLKKLKEDKKNYPSSTS